MGSSDILEDVLADSGVWNLASWRAPLGEDRRGYRVAFVGDISIFGPGGPGLTGTMDTRNGLSIYISDETC